MTRAVRLAYRLLMPHFCHGLVAALLALVALSAAAAETPRYYVPEVPQDMSQVDFYLLTVGVGPQVVNRFGHTGIRVVDKAGKSDVVFEWGRFQFDQGNFLWKFFRGSLVYSMGVRTFKSELSFRQREERAVVQERLNLTGKQKRRLMEKIAWNAVPENRSFPYQYWFKNCSTIPRDYIDEVLEGQVRSTFFAAEADRVFRDYVRANLSAVPFVVPSLDIMMNANIDRPITGWEEMFLPARLRANLLAMPSVDDEGNPVPGTRLLTETTVLADAPESFDAPFNDYLALAGLYGVPLVFGLVLLLLRGDARSTARGYLLVGLATTLYGLFGGAFGLTLLLNWLFSGHPDGWQNVNLLVFFPVDLVYAVIGVKLMRARAPVKDRFPVAHAGALLGAAHLIALALLVLLSSVGVVQQDVWRIVGWFGVPLAGLAAVLGFYGYAHAPAGAAQRTPASSEAIPARSQV